MFLSLEVYHKNPLLNLEELPHDLLHTSCRDVKNKAYSYSFRQTFKAMEDNSCK